MPPLTQGQLSGISDTPTSIYRDKNTSSQSEDDRNKWLQLPLARTKVGYPGSRIERSVNHISQFYSHQIKEPLRIVTSPPSQGLQ